MKKLSILLLLLSSLLAFGGETIVSLEVQEIYGKLGYDYEGVVLLKVGDFGEGGGGNRPIKTISAEESESSLPYYYPNDFRIIVNKAPEKLLKKIPLHMVKVFNIIANQEIIKYKMDEVYSFDLNFENIIDLNNMSVKNILSFTTIDGKLFFPTDIVSIEIKAIIEP